jgi:hypothetical protein
MIRLAAAVLLASVAVPSMARAQEFAPLLDQERRDLLHEALSGEIAKDHVIQITRHHRIQGSRGYRGAAQYVLQQLHAYGFTEGEAYIESFPSDGRLHYQTWQSPSGWDISLAELRMVEPYEERIVGYPEIAMSLITYSNPGDVTAELVWVGRGTQDADYEGKDVRGKFVLATGYGGSVHRVAVLQHGAAAVVCYLDDNRAKLFPDMLQYTGMWPRSEELDGVTFGFNITKRQGERLRAMLERGERVVLHGRAEGIGLEPYFMDIVVARIPGSELPDEEIIFSAHLDHPKESANDNASGSAAILDMARALKALIDEGRLPRPKRSLRFLWVPEWYGTMAYIDAHPEMVGPELGGTVLANINMDMVGEHPELLHSRMIMTRTPASMPSALNDVVENMAQMVDRMSVRSPRGSLSRFNFAVTPYGGGSDHMMFIDRKIPGMMFGHSPDYTHHTSEDTPDKVDPVELERSEIIGAATALYLSDLSEAEALDLTYLVGARSLGQVADAARQMQRMLSGVSRESFGEEWFEAKNVMAHVVEWERRALGSVLQFHDAPRVRYTVDRWQVQLGFFSTANKALLFARADSVLGGALDAAGERPAPPDDRVTERLTRGPLDFGLPASELPAEGRTVSEIRDALSAEYGPVDQGVVARYVEDLVRVGVVGWK